MRSNTIALILMLTGVCIIIFGKQLDIFMHLNPLIFTGAGLVLFITGVSRLQLKAVPRYLNDEDQLISYLKLHGDKIRVDLSQCVIKEHNYSKEIAESEKNEHVSWGLNSVPLGGLYPVDKVEQRNVTQSVILYEAPYKGKNMKFRSHIISKDKTTLLFYFYAQKETYIYMSPKDGNTYYFDLEFLYR